MIQQTLRLSVLISLIGISCSSDPIQVISGVFMPNNISVNYDGAKVACNMHHSRLATLENITFAYTNGYELCKWGWIEEKKIVMLRMTPFQSCAGYNLGILIKDCPNIKFTFCANSAGFVHEIPIPTSLVPSYENASNTCEGLGFTIATKKQIENSTSTITKNRLAWYNWGVGQMNNGIFEPDTCYNTLNYASAFCYNPALSDFLIIDDTLTRKKISIACIIAFIFIILLLTAAFMRGNRCICCMPEKQHHAAETPPVAVPTWNTTSVYRRISKAGRNSLYDNRINPDRRLTLIRPELSHYKTHYSNMAFDITEEM